MLRCKICNMPPERDGNLDGSEVIDQDAGADCASKKICSNTVRDLCKFSETAKTKANVQLGRGRDYHNM